MHFQIRRNIMLSYNSVKELVDLAVQNNCHISELCIRDQAKKMGKTEDELFEQMEKCFETMCESAEWGEQKGRRSTSGLTGDEGYLMKKYAEKDGGLMGKPMSRAVSRALAVSNCNAAMGKIVATPTAGSCGILPGCLITAYKERQMPKKDIVMSIFTAAAFGMIIAQKASIAGAQGGCQAECGSASGMAAAALVEELYIVNQNSEKFLSTFNDETASNVTFRIILVLDAINRLTEYDEEIKPIDEALSPLSVLNATTVAEMKSQLEAAKDQIVAARNAIVQQ
jgi:L-serine deaminase